ncbi:MAG: HAD family hydrolase [Tetrasphaera sp.]
MHPAHLVALDIDGTTITHTGDLRDPVRDAVARAAAAGHHLVLATGRTVLGTLPILDRLNLRSGYAVCSNGAVTVALDPGHPSGYDIIEAVTFDPAPALELLRDAWPDAVVAVEDLGVGFKVSAPFPDALDGVVTVVPWEELMAAPVTRLTFRSATGTSEDFLRLAHRIGLHEMNYAVGFSAWLDINPEGVSKGSALEHVRRRLGVDAHHTVAVGDQRNDIEMLRWARRGVAMGNAPAEVQDVADEVTGTVEEDGLAQVLDSLPGILHDAIRGGAGASGHA